MDKETREALKKEIDRKVREKLAKLEKDKTGEVDLNTLRENESRGEWPPSVGGSSHVNTSAHATHRANLLRSTNRRFCSFYNV